MSNVLSNKKIVITGAAQGIGRSIASAMAFSGADVVIHYYKNNKGAQDVCDQIQRLGVSATMIQADFTRSDELELFFKRSVDALGDIDVLVNSAASYISKPFVKVTEKDLCLMHQVNVLAPMQLMQIFAAHCIQHNRSGSVINISSISGLMPSNNSTLNSCSKASLNMLTKCAALELAQNNIRVNAIAPGLIDTDSNQGFKLEDPAGWQHAISEIPLNRAGQPLDCAQLAVFLASEQSSWITGAVIPVDGGATISWRA